MLVLVTWKFDKSHCASTKRPLKELHSEVLTKPSSLLLTAFKRNSVKTAKLARYVQHVKPCSLKSRARLS